MKINLNGKEVEISDEIIKSSLETPEKPIELNVDNLVLRTSEEDATYKNNTYKDAHAVGIEIGRKNILKGLGIEVDGAHRDDSKSVEVVNNFINSKISKEIETLKIEPNKKVEELTKDINLLKSSVATISQEKDDVLNQFQSYKKTQSLTSTFMSVIPENIILPKEDIMLILNTKIKADIDENGNAYAIGNDGEPIKNLLTSDKLPLKEVVSNFFKENPHYVKAASGGAGGGDSVDKGAKQDVDGFIKEMKEKSITPNSFEFNAEMKKRIESGLLSV